MCSNSKRIEQNNTRRPHSNSNNNNIASSNGAHAAANVCGRNTSNSNSRSNKMSRKDDPVFNVKFVQLVESHPCLWNSTHPGYSKKEEIQKAWQEVANETKDTVRNCRERWRTIRSSFLRSLKLARTSTGRGKRKYYLSKYLQFLIPHTKTRIKNGASTIIALRKSDYMPPMTRISNMPLPIVSSDETKDSSNSEVAIADGDVVCAIQDDAMSMMQNRMITIKTEQGETSATAANGGAANNATTTNALSPTKQLASAGGGGNNSNAGGTANSNNFLMDLQQPRSSSAVDLTEFADWIKSKNELFRHCTMQTTPDADQSFLNSLHPFLKEMTGKQNRRFRQKVVALIDTILDDVD